MNLRDCANENQQTGILPTSMAMVLIYPGSTSHFLCSENIRIVVLFCCVSVPSLGKRQQDGTDGFSLLISWDQQPFYPGFLYDFLVHRFSVLLPAAGSAAALFPRQSIQKRHATGAQFDRLRLWGEKQSSFPRLHDYTQLSVWSSLCAPGCQDAAPTNQDNREYSLQIAVVPGKSSKMGPCRRRGSESRGADLL